MPYKECEVLKSAHVVVTVFEHFTLKEYAVTFLPFTLCTFVEWYVANVALERLPARYCLSIVWD